MAISEADRHDLYTGLEQALGRKRAAILMEHLPPVGWADVATKRDLEVLETRLDARFDRVEARVALRLAQNLRTTVLTNIGAVVAVGSLVLAR